MHRGRHTIGTCTTKDKQLEDAKQKGMQLEHAQQKTSNWNTQGRKA